MKIVFRVVGALLVFFGAVWFLQGVNVLPGSVMTGQTKWAIIGGICFIAGVLLFAFSGRINPKR